MTDQNNNEQTEDVGSDFIRQIISEDLAQGKNNNKVLTRFPPEPNGYLHIGHAKSICLNFGIAEDFSGLCNLRYDDTNPDKESTEYVDAILEDVKWLGFDPEDRIFYASDYYQQLYDFAEHLIQAGKAYVCSLNAEETRQYRGTLTQAGKNSPYRDRSIEENLEIFRKMKAGDCQEGDHVLRAKIDMASPNLNMRDPVIYRIRHSSHHRTGKDWCLYPMYDYTHCISDALEGITHSLCTLEFEDHRPLYDWVLDNLPVPCHPQQIEFARLNLPYTVVSKRKLLQLVTDKHVEGWDDPRMPTLSAMRRRGFTPEAIREFCSRIGVAKANSMVDIALLYFCQREDLNKKAQRVMAVLRPLKVIIDNYPEGKVEELDALNNPEDESMGKRKIPFSKTLYIEQDDFREEAPRKYFRLKPGQEVRFKDAYYLTCQSFVKDEQTGEVTEVHCTYDPDTKGGWSEDGRKVKGTVHWVSAEQALKAEVRLYEHLFSKENPEAVEEGRDFTANINPDSLEVIKEALLEPSLASAQAGDRFQFLRMGYYCVDKDSKPEKLVINRVVPLRDSWSKIEQKNS